MRRLLARILFFLLLFSVPVQAFAGEKKIRILPAEIE